jgi:hypothetical protein
MRRAESARQVTAMTGTAAGEGVLSGQRQSRGGVGMTRAREIAKVESYQTRYVC